jgi:TolB-like protein/Tfp pilus assembly protein PilF
MSFIEELKRRNVFRVGIAYVVSAWILLQFVDLVLENIQAPDWVMKVFMLALAIGFPLAIFFAWAFEMTPEGIKKEKDVDRSQSITPKTGRKLDRTIMAVMAVALIWFAWDRFGGAGDAPVQPIQEQPTQVAEEKVQGAPARSIAVLPFVNMSSDPEQEYFSDGISEEILNVLARIPELKVAARTSAFAYKGANINVSEIARELKVENVLEGSVRKSGNQVRVTAQLIKADDGYHLWSATFDRELTNIFAIQDEIATSIADALKVTLELKTSAAGNLTGTASTEAYDAYLRGINQWHLRTGESLYNSISLFEEAIEIDPQFARAHAGLALTYAVIMDYTEMPSGEARAKAKRAADFALSLDPELIEAASALILTTNDLNKQIEYSRLAIALNPSFATTHQWYATALALTGDLEAAEKEYRAAVELDPRSRVVVSNLAYNYIALAQWDNAERVLIQLLSWAPEYASAMDTLFMVKLAKGDQAGAREVAGNLVKALKRTEDNTDLYLDLFFEPSRRAGAIKTIMSWPHTDRWAPENPRIVDDETLLWMLAKTGEFEKAWVLLSEVIETGGNYAYGYYRIERGIPEFVCHPKTVEILAATDLPPLEVPYPCDELL